MERKVLLPKRGARAVTRADEPLSEKEKLFVLEYLKDFNGSRAASAVGIARATCGWWASNVIKKPNVLVAIHDELQRRRRECEIQAAEVISYHMDAANADPRKLTPFVVGACRYCWGEDHEYQHTRGEMRERLRSHQLKYPDPKKRPMLDTKGGDGFDRLRDPMRGPRWEDKANSDHDCPECQGIGLVVVLPPDLNQLSRGELLIYGGIKINKDGSYEVRLNPRLPHMDRVTELVGLVRPRRAKWEFNLDEIDEGQLDALLEEAQNRGLLTSSDMQLIEGSAEVVPEPGQGSDPKNRIDRTIVIDSGIDSD